MIKVLKYFSLTILIIWGLLIGAIYINSLIDEKRSVDAIVVLGASQWNGKPSPALRSRLDHAYNIYKEGYAKYIILTGGIARGEKISESKVGLIYLEKKGIPKNKIFIEEIGLTTSESLKRVSVIIKEQQFKETLFISHGYHIFRVKKIARDLNIEKVYASPVKTKDMREKIKFVFRESLIFPIYIIDPNYGLKFKNI